MDLACWQSQSSITLSGDYLSQPSENSSLFPLPFDWFSDQYQQQATGTTHYWLKIINAPTDDLALQTGFWLGHIQIFQYSVAADGPPTNEQLIYDNQFAEGQFSNNSSVVLLNSTFNPTLNSTLHSIRDATFDTAGSDFYLEFRLSNFTEYTARASESPQLGHFIALQNQQHFEYARAALLAGCFMGISLFLLVFWWVLRQRIEFLALSASSAVLGIRFLDSEMLLSALLPNINPVFGAYIGWGTFYALGITWSLYFITRFKIKAINFASYGFLISAAIGVLLLSNYELGVQYGIQFYRPIAAILLVLLFSLYFYYARKERHGLLAGIAGLIVCVASIIDICLYVSSNRLAIDASNFAFIILLVSQSANIAGAYRYNLKEKSRLSKEIGDLHKNIEHKVQVRTKELTTENQKLATLSLTDELTQLPNRRCFDIKLADEISHHDNELGLLMIDIDLFKSINDRYGHSIGDQVLQRVAAELNEICRTSDLAARIGGEEFAVVLPNSQSGCLQVAERLRSNIAALNLVIQNQEIKLTASIGAAIYQPGEEVCTFIERCDKELYQAKHLGRNQVSPKETALLINHTASIAN